MRQENNKAIRCVTTKDALISKISLGHLSLAPVIKAVVQCSNHIQMQGKQPSVVRLHGCISHLSCCRNKLPHKSNRREMGVSWAQCIMVMKSGNQELETAGSVVSMVRKEIIMAAPSQLAFSFLFSSRPSP